MPKHHLINKNDRLKQYSIPASAPLRDSSNPEAKAKSNPKSGPVPSIFKGQSHAGARPKGFEGPLPRASPSQTICRTCPKSNPVPSILKRMSQEQATPKHRKGHVPRATLPLLLHPSLLASASNLKLLAQQRKGLSQARAYPKHFQGPVPRARLSQPF